MSERQGVEIDYCPSCRGVWLDRGELDKIIEKASQSEQGQSSGMNQAYGDKSYKQHSGHDQHKYKDHDHYKHKKKNWLSDLFD
jgi:Zn-finger nucleic acid-binding protein